ncbi:MAG: hypothetical protein MUC50_07630 [Myxococcota bacterium]|nr:hypothetical protein [Myxococcota bacterium]
MSTESESQSPSTEETSETESQSATVETESQTQGSDTIAAACDALADCEWQYDDCVEFTNPDDRECLSLTLCGGTKLATRQEACDIQCPLGECQISQAIEHIDSDTASLDLCAEPGELRCR